MQQKPDRVAIGVAGCFLAFLVVFAGISAGLFLWLRPHPASPGGRPAAAAGTATSAVTGSGPVPVAPAEPPALPASSPPPAVSAAPAEPSSEPRPGLIGDSGPSPSGTTGGAQAGAPSGTTGNNPSPGGARSAAPGPKDSTGAGGCTLNLNSIPPSAVSLDGRPIGGTPAMGVAASCGPHSVTFVHAERGKKTISITLTAGKPGTVGVKF